MKCGATNSIPCAARRAKMFGGCESGATAHISKFRWPAIKIKAPQPEYDFHENEAPLAFIEVNASHKNAG